MMAGAFSDVIANVDAQRRLQRWGDS